MFFKDFWDFILLRQDSFVDKFLTFLNIFQFFDAPAITERVAFCFNAYLKNYYWKYLLECPVPLGQAVLIVASVGSNSDLIKLRQSCLPIHILQIFTCFVYFILKKIQTSRTRCGWKTVNIKSWSWVWYDTYVVHEF